MKTNTILSTAFFIFVLSVILSGCKENAYTVSTETVIHALVPDVAYPGDTVTLYGSNLGGHNASVKINGVEAAFVKGDEDKIVIVVPQTVSGDVVLKTSRGEFTLTNGLSVYGNVSIDSFYPAIVTTGTKLVIKGKGFDLQKLRSNVVRITPDQGETYAVHLQTESVTADSIVVIVDQKFDQGQISVAVGKFEAITTSDIRYLDLPRIDDITPTRGGSGTIITLTGVNFITDNLTDNVVTCGDKPLEVIEVLSSTTMKVKVPEALNVKDKITLSLALTGSSESEKRFTFDGARDFDWGGYGMMYDGEHIALTQGTVDSLLNMGVTFMCFKVTMDKTNGFMGGILPTTTPVVREGVTTDRPTAQLDNMIKVKKMSQNKIKVIMLINHPRTVGENSTFIYVPTPFESNTSETLIQNFLDATKSYKTPGYDDMTLWDAVDAFQLLYNTATNVENYYLVGQLPRYRDVLLKPVWNYVHPTGISLAGEKKVVSLQAVFGSNANSIFNAEHMLANGWFDYLDVFNFQWNVAQPSGQSNTNATHYYATNLPQTVFDAGADVIRTLMEDVPPISFLSTEMNVTVPTVRFATIESLENAFVTTISGKFHSLPGYKGFCYMKFHADFGGIRSLDNGLNNMVDVQPGNTIPADGTASITPPSYTHYQMYSNIVTRLNALK